MDRTLIVVLVAAAAAVVALVAARRRPAPPTQPAAAVPHQLDRSDFSGVDHPWLVAVFTSSTCGACGGVVDEARALERLPGVAVQELEAVRDRDVHRRYGIDAVPIVVVADADGVVTHSFVGPPSPGALAAAVTAAVEGSDA